MKRVTISPLSLGLCWAGDESGQNIRRNGINSEFTGIQNIAIVLSLFALSLALRVAFLGNTFQSSDNAELAFKILTKSGYTWIIREYYGALINVYVKFFVALVSSLGVTITEFWWKAPIAILGSLQGPLIYLFLKQRVGCSSAGALFGAAFVSILPIHVFESRYLWGYEVLGAFFVTLAIWKLIDFFGEPTVKSGLVASFFSALYLISHGYILPFLPMLLAMMFLFAPASDRGVVDQFITALRLLSRKLVWICPLLLVPLYVYPIGHAVRKPTRIGFYLREHIPGFMENTGYFVAFLIILAAVGAVSFKTVRSKFALLFLLGGAAYLAPLFLATPQGITSVRGYMLVGTYLLFISAIIILDRLVSMSAYRKPLIVIVIVCFVGTLWGSVESIFGRDQLLDPSGIKVKRGSVPPDPGSKAAGLLIRKYVKHSEKVLAIHGAVEPPNLFYYFARSEHSFFDLSQKRAMEKFYRLKDQVDVVVCDESQASVLRSDDSFIRRVVIMSEGSPAMLIFAKAHVEMPIVNADVRELNRLFDKEYAWMVSFR